MKRCTKCDEEKDEGEFPRRAASRDGLDYWCRGCWKLHNAAYFAANTEKVRAQNRRRHNAEKSNARNKKWREANPERYRELGRNAQRKAWKTLPDFFMRKHLRDVGFAAEHITPELIELYRVKLLLHRQIKEMSK